MKTTRILVFLTTATALTGCGINTQTPKTGSIDFSALENAYMRDALVADATDDSFTGEVDDNVKSSIAEDRLNSMTDKLMTELDDDKSGTVSEQEFLAGAKRRHHAEHGTEMETEKEHHLSEKVLSAAGDDKVLTKDELKAFLKNRANAVHHRRHRDDDKNRQNTTRHTGTDDGRRGSTENDSRGRGVSDDVTRTGETETRREVEHGGRPRASRGHF